MNTKFSLIIFFSILTASCSTIEKTDRAPANDENNCAGLVKVIINNEKAVTKQRSEVVNDFAILSAELKKISDESIKFSEDAKKGILSEFPKGIQGKVRANFYELLKKVTPDTIQDRKKLLVKLFNDASSIKYIDLENSKELFADKMIDYISSQGKIIEKDKLNHFLTQLELLLKSDSPIAFTEAEREILNAWEKDSLLKASKLFQDLPSLVERDLANFESYIQRLKAGGPPEKIESMSKETKKMLVEMLTAIAPHSLEGKNKLLTFLFANNNEFINNINPNKSLDSFSFELVWDKIAPTGYLADKSQRDAFFSNLKRVIRKEVSLEFSAKEIAEKKVLQLRDLKSLKSQIENGEDGLKAEKVLAVEFRVSDKEKFEMIHKAFGERASLLTANLPGGESPRAFTAKLIEQMNSLGDSTNLIKLIDFFVEKNQN